MIERSRNLDAVGQEAYNVGSLLVSTFFQTLMSKASFLW